MTDQRKANFKHVLVLGAVMAALGLAGCGRKGGLDAPPSASAAPQGQETQERQTGLSPLGAMPANDPVEQRSVLGQRAGIGPDGRPIAPVGERRRIPLDALID